MEAESAPVLAGGHASRTTATCMRMNFALYVGGPGRHRRAGALGALGHLGGRRARATACCACHEAVPAHRLLVVAVLRVAAGRDGAGEGLRPARRDFAIAQAHHRGSGEAGGSIDVDARGHRGDLWGAKRRAISSACPTSTAPAPPRARRTDGLHIVEDQILVEVVGPGDGRGAVPMARRGELVYTTLMKTGAPDDPLPHVATSAHVQHARPCECGRTLTRIHIQRPQGRDVHRERRERVPERHRVRGAQR